MAHLASLPHLPDLSRRVRSRFCEFFSSCSKTELIVFLQLKRFDKYALVYGTLDEKECGRDRIPDGAVQQLAVRLLPSRIVARYSLTDLSYYRLVSSRS